MAQSLPPEPAATLRELEDAPEQWSIVSFTPDFVTYMDRRARMLVVPIRRSEPPLHDPVEAHAPAQTRR